MNTEHLRSFIKVVECGGITSAAKIMYITPPSLHQQIKLLEKEVGFPLFVRKGKQLQLTEAGSVFYRTSKQLLERLDSAIIRGRQLQNKGERPLVIGYFLREDLYRVDEFSQQHPEYTIISREIEWDGSFHNLDMKVLNQYYDVVFCEYADHHPALRFVEIAENEVVFAAMCSPKHPLATKSFVTKEDLADQTVYSFRHYTHSTILEQIQQRYTECITIPFSGSRNELLDICYDGMIFIAEEKYLMNLPLTVLPLFPELKEKHGILYANNSDHPILKQYLDFIAKS